MDRSVGGLKKTGGSHADMQVWQIGTEIETQSYTYASSGRFNNAVIASNGSMWVAGYGGFGQLGQNNTASASSAVQIPAGAGRSWISVEQGVNNMFGIKDDGTLWVWGQDQYGM